MDPVSKGPFPKSSKNLRYNSAFESLRLSSFSSEMGDIVDAIEDLLFGVEEVMKEFRRRGVCMVS